MTTQLDRPVDRATLPDVVFRRWLHSREEDRDGVEVYRPEDFPFPVSHARDGFEIRADGRFVQEKVGPADELVRVPGHWALLAPRRVGVALNDAGTPDRFAFDILDVDDTVLRIHRLSRHPGPAGVGNGADPARAADFAARPAASAYRLIDFDDARILHLDTFPGRLALQVSGMMPYANMTVSLEPVVYVQQPEYWEIEVVGHLPGIGLPVLTPYTVSRPLAGVIGKAGIDVVGATTYQRFDFPTGNTQ